MKSACLLCCVFVFIVFKQVSSKVHVMISSKFILIS